MGIQKLTMAGSVRNLCAWLLLLALAVLPAISQQSQNFKTLYTFTDGSDGGYPESGVILINGTLYGTATYGGLGRGIVYSVNTGGTAFHVLFKFPGTESYPGGNFVISSNILYTTAHEPGVQTGFGGSIIEVPLDVTGQFPSNWYDFTPLFGDGTDPDGVILSGSLLYGVTRSGGQFDQGTIYDYDGSIVTNLYAFAGSDGANPNGSLVLYDGTLFGVTQFGGNSGNGTVYTVNADGSGFKTLHHFSGSTSGEGANPLAGLILWGNTLFGTTSSGGTSSNGTVFSLSTNGTDFATLYSFSGGRDGTKPAAALNLAGNTLYGTTMNGGTWGWGTVFALGTDGSGFTTLHSFNAVDGAYPLAKMLLSGNTLYGTTSGNLFTNWGTVFSLWLGVAPPQPPQLTITPSGQNVVLTWPANGSFFLQTATNLVSSPVWSKVLPGPVVINGQNTVTNLISTTVQFYRLSQ